MPATQHISSEPARIPDEESRGSAVCPRPFSFDSDAFHFANELMWEYIFDKHSGTTRFVPRDPKPEYAHRCFVLVRAARQFFNHASFNSGETPAGISDVRQRIREVLNRSPRVIAALGTRVNFPGFANLRQFSSVHEADLKAELGGAWRSYIMRSHWRMVFPYSRAHQSQTAQRLCNSIRQKGTAAIHLVRFPILSINHGMLLYAIEENQSEIKFRAYDPNSPEAPASLTFLKDSRTFTLPQNRYWAGGRVDIMEIYRNWFT